MTRMATSLVGFLLVPAFLHADTNMASSVLDSAGGHSSGGTYAMVSAVGQPGGTQVATAGDTVLYAGFLNTFALQPELDTDQDGLADEVDQDNDNDTLSDLAEVSGSAHGYVTPSDPNRADTDSDGIADGDEAFAGTDPRDDTALLRITGVSRSDAGVDIIWQARGGKSYSIYALDHPDGMSTYLGNINAVGGTAPWSVVYTNFNDAVTQNESFYRITVE